MSDLPEPRSAEPRPPETSPPEPQPGWRAAARDVGIVSVLAVGIVLGAAGATGLLPAELQRVVFHTPLTIAILVVGTGWVLYRIARPGR